MHEPEPLRWAFPLPRTHTGILLGNGRTGFIIWGQSSTLRITVGRADLWDHRGGMSWTERHNYAAIRKCLEAHDAEGIARIFRTDTEDAPDRPPRPSVLPLGRIEINLSRECRLEEGLLDAARGIVAIRYRIGAARKVLSVCLHPLRDLGWIRGIRDIESISHVTSWDLLGDRLEALSFEPPETIDRGSLRGWQWRLPADPGVLVAWDERNVRLNTTQRPPSGPDAFAEDAIQELEGAASKSSDSSEDVIPIYAERFDAASNVDELRDRLAQGTSADAAIPVSLWERESLTYWYEYWESVPRVRIPDPALREMYDYGLFSFAGLTNPIGVPATLQGPWIEEYDFPPWSSDYHFNINVQMCYGPAFLSGHVEHLLPLFRMVWSWRERLRENARHFVGIEDGFLLPHAVDDRATCMGSFWTGAIDHACTAWVAQMMFDYVDYSGDLAFLREVAFPFMKGAFAVYFAMLEFSPRGGFRLPVSVSPEYRGAAMNAWGANASFQLAAIHRLCENLLDAARWLDEPANPSWADVHRQLAAACVSNDESPRILLWEGTDLEESHRHHSHLAGITPFDTIDIESDQWRGIVANSIHHWIRRGMGLWSGWCMSWASRIFTRLGNGDAAELMLQLWRRLFTNDGRGSMHDAQFNGVSVMGAPPVFTGRIERERMQMDAVMGAVTAVQEMLLHDRRGVLYVMSGVPHDWEEASFEEMPARGGLRVSAWYRRGRVERIEISATRTADARVGLPAGTFRVTVNAIPFPASGPVIRIELRKLDRLVIVATE